MSERLRWHDVKDDRDKLARYLQEKSASRVFFFYTDSQIFYSKDGALVHWCKSHEDALEIWESLEKDGFVCFWPCEIVNPDTLLGKDQEHA